MAVLLMLHEHALEVIARHRRGGRIVLRLADYKLAVVFLVNVRVRRVHLGSLLVVVAVDIGAD